MSVQHDSEQTRGDQARGQRSRPFGGYYNRPAPTAPNPLTEVGPGTPGGEYLRRYWHPIMLTRELTDLPQAIRILGEDLVIFRDGSGAIGLLHKQCIHRGASLEFGIPQQHGIMCCYHGWKFDVDGTVLGVGAEPETSRIPKNFCQGAYPVREAHGLIFAYMGPPEQMPVFPEYDTFSHPEGGELYPIKMRLPCNWVQIVDNACDPIHNAYLHAIVSGQQFSAAFNTLPALDFVPTPLGFLSMATRLVGDNVFIRASDIMMPNVAQFASGNNAAKDECFHIACYLTRWAVPVDDHNSFYTGLIHVNPRTRSLLKVDPSELGVDRMSFIGQTADRPYEDRQREPGDYDALVSQGPVTNHRNEHLGTTDRGVVMFRRMLGRAIEAVRIGETPELPRLYETGPVRTYNHELVFKLPSQSNITDMQSLAAFGRRAAELVVESDTLPPLERERVTAERVRKLLADNLVSDRHAAAE
ncbi:MAG TPA: aromatic ring-hydroxylating dioxygenase subunit alpha [Stellaceae bacterium]|jgi:nitrite reductase/ring-hydroxylating ferredoxin subunit|nr:aromatic ring-hydroxylating dioxygenase subunit alpha [Stellaceae bacterium]